MIDESPFAKHANGAPATAPVDGAPVERTTVEQGPCAKCGCVALDHPASNYGTLPTGVPFCACEKCPGYVDSNAPHAPTEAEAQDIGRPELSIETITFDELVAIGREQNPGRVEMPWSFTYQGLAVTRETDDCYLVGNHRFDRGNSLSVRDGVVTIVKPTPAPAPMWICTNCGTTNAQAPADAIVEKCAKCSEPSEAQKARIAAGLGAISGGVGTAAEVEETARKMEGVEPPPRQPLPPPKDRMLPYRGTSKTGRFDAFDALDALKESRDRVIYCQNDHDADVKRGKASGLRLKEAEAEYFQLFDSIYERKEKAEVQPELGLEEESPYVSSECQVERSTGAPCPACQSQRAKGKPADPSEPLHPAHPQHEDVAKALLIADQNKLLEQLQQKNVYLEIEELQSLPVADMQALQRYAVQRGPIPSESAAALLKHAHLAAEAGTDRQECKHCGMALIDRKDIDAGVTFYPVNVLVGLDCEGSAKAKTVGERLADTDAAAGQPPAAPPTDDAPRKPKSHARKNAKKKTDPEQERKHQAVEGRKKAAPAPGKKKAAKTSKKR